jgi:hypothetical protein
MAVIPGKLCIKFCFILAPILEVALVNQTFVESPGLEVSLTCSINGGIGSSVEIVWSGPVDLPEPTMTESSDGIFTSNLTLTNVTSTFTGIYQCTGRYNNSLCFTGVSSNASLVVIAPPIIIDQTTLDSNIDLASLNDIVMLMCISSGGPSNTYEWAKDEIVLDGETSDTLTLIIANGSSGGNYTCTVSNAAGSDSASTTLYVLPFIVAPLEEQILTVVGSFVRITCEAGGFPTPDISWVQVNTDMTITQVSNSSLLEFIVDFRNAGVYRCVAVAEIGGVLFNITNEMTLFGKSY